MQHLQYQSACPCLSIYTPLYLSKLFNVSLFIHPALCLSIQSFTNSSHVNPFVRLFTFLYYSYILELLSFVTSISVEELRYVLMYSIELTTFVSTVGSSVGNHKFNVCFCFCKYLSRLPFSMKGMTMQGEKWWSKLTPVRVRTFGWEKDFIFMISSTASLTSPTPEMPTIIIIMQ